MGVIKIRILPGNEVAFIKKLSIFDFTEEDAENVLKFLPKTV